MSEEPLNSPTEPTPEGNPVPNKKGPKGQPFTPKVENRKIHPNGVNFRMFTDEVEGFEQLRAEIGRQLGNDGPATPADTIRACMYHALHGDGYQFPKSVSRRKLATVNLFKYI